MKLVILITSQSEHGFEVAEAWQRAGSPGVTVIRTHGLYSLQERVRSGEIELPRMVASMAAAMAHILTDTEEKGQLLLSVVDDELVDKLITEAQTILGDLDKPDNGVMFVLPIDRAIGVIRHDKQNKG